MGSFTFKVKKSLLDSVWLAALRIGGAAAERDGSWMMLAKGFRTPDEQVRASFVSDNFLH